MAGGQSLRLSTDNEQNLCNLAHCFVGGASVPTYPQAARWGRQGGLMNERIGKSATTTEHLRSSRYWGCRVPHAKHSPRLSVRFTTTGASPTLPIYIVPSAQCRCSFAPRRDPTFVTYSPDTQTFVLHVHTRSHRGATLQTPLYQYINRAADAK